MAVQIVDYNDKVSMTIDHVDCGASLTEIGENFEVSRKTVRRCIDEVLDFYNNLKVGQKVYRERDPDVIVEIIHKDEIIADMTPIRVRDEDGDEEWYYLDSIMEANVGVDFDTLQGKVEKEFEENAEYFVVAPQDSITIMRVDQDSGEMNSHNINKNDANFGSIRQMISKNQSKETLREAYYLMNTKTALEAFSVGRVKVDPEGETVVFVKADGTERSVPSDLAGDIITTVKQYGQSESERLVRFLDYLMDNPSFSAIEGLYRFMKHNCIEINDDGTIRAWKGVRNDLYDKRSGTIYNGNFGQEIRVDRSEVDDNSDNTCSYGLHVGSKEYATMWGETLLCVTVNPKDVVAVPHDYNGAKMRCCAYTPNFVA